MRRLELRHVPGTSVIHRLRAEVKVLCLLGISMAVAFQPQWPVIGGAAAGLVVVFLLARLPSGVIAPPPPLFFMIIGFSGMFALLSGGDPEVGGFGLGGVIDLARLISLGLTLIAYAALLAWTTTPAGVGLGIGRLLRPLGRIGLPADELATVVALTVRSLPLIRDELMIAYDARRTRPEPHGGQRPIRDLVDMGAVVVVGAHRRAGELSQALIARGSVTAPPDDPQPLALRDVVALATVAAITVTVFVVV
jgi:energy-coupling factor transport system permease protein